MNSLNTGEIETQEVLYGKTIAQIDRKTPSATDLTIVGDPATGISGAATVADMVKSVLPTGTNQGDLLAWSRNANEWASLPINQIDRKGPAPTDLTVIGDPDTGKNWAASVGELVASGLPAGHHHADLLAWSVMTGAWAPLPFAPLSVNIAAGAAGSIPYQTAADHTAMLPIGTTGQVLTVGADGPKWHTLSDLNFNIAALASADVDDSSFLCGSFSNWDENEYIEIPINCAHVKLDGLLTAKTINIQNTMGGAPNLQTFSAASLVSAGLVNFNGLSSLTQLNIPNLLECGGLYITGCNSLTQFRPPCHTYNGDIQASFNAELTNFQIGPARSARGIQVAENPKLKFFSLPYDLNLYGQEISLQGNALVTTNGILHTAAQWDGKYGRHFWGGPGTWLNISGGTNAAPTSDGGFDGIAAAQALIARGCTVTVNGAPITTTKKVAYVPDIDTAADAGKNLVVQSDGTTTWLLSNSSVSAYDSAVAIKDFSGNYVQYSKLSSYGHSFTGLTVPNLTGLTYQDNLFIDRISVLNRCPALTSISAPVCRQIGNIEINDHPAIASISMPFLRSSGNISIYNSPNLATISMGKIFEITGSLTGVHSNPKLTTMQFFGGAGGRFFGNFNFSNNALIASSLNSIFNALKNGEDQYGPYGRGKSVNVSGGTNESLNNGIQGWWDAQELVERGCTVTYNGTPFTSTKRAAYIPNFDTVADPGKVVAVKADGTGLEWTSRAYTGNYVATPLSGQTGVTLFNLLSITGSFTVSSNSTITSIDLGQLQRLGGSFLNTAANCPELTSISGPNLTDASGNWWFTGSAKLTTFSFPYLRTARTFVLTGFGVTQFSLPALELMDDSLELYNFPELSSINFQRLQIVSNQFRFSNIPKLTGASFNQLKKVSFDIKFDNCGALTYVSLESLESIGGNLDFQSGTPNLSSFTLNEGFIRCGVAGKRVLFTSCALNQTSVDGLLIRLAALDGTGGTAIFSNRIVTITGTSAAPSATGVTAKNTLVARGCTVTTN